MSQMKANSSAADSTKDPGKAFVILTDDVLQLIVSKYVPVVMWPKLELTNERFRKAVLSAYGTLESLNLFAYYPATYRHLFKTLVNHKKSVRIKCLFNKISTYCFALKALYGLRCIYSLRTPKRTVNQLSNFRMTMRVLNLEGCHITVERFLHLLEQFDDLTVLDMSECQLYYSTDYNMLPSFENDQTDEQGTEEDSVENTQAEEENSQQEEPDTNELTMNRVVRNMETRLAACFTKYIHLQSLTLPSLCFFSGDFLTSIHAETLNNLTLITCFHIKYVVEFLQRCINLKCLDLSLSKVIDSHDELHSQFSIFACFPNLHSLHSMKITGQGLSSENDPFGWVEALVSNVALCHQLRVLHLPDFAISFGELSRIVDGCPMLKSFTFETENEECLTPLMHLRNLQHLSIELFIPSPTDFNLSQHLIHLKYLESISLYTNLDSTALYTLSDIESLRRIRLDGNIVCNEQVIIRCCKAFRSRLLSFELQGYWTIDDGICSDIAHYCRNLQNLDLHLSTITDASVFELAACCSQLEYVDLCQSMRRENAVSKNSILTLIRSCLKLSTVYINRNTVRDVLEAHEFTEFKFRVLVTEHSIEGL